MKRPEQAIHKAVADHIRARVVKGAVWFTVGQSNYGKNKKGKAIQASINKGLGVRAGVSDIIFLHRGLFFAIELKAPGNTPTEDQYKFLADVEAAGGFSAWAVGVDRALKVLEMWGLIRGVTA